MIKYTDQRLRRAKKTRLHIKRLNTRPRLSVYKSSNNIYATVYSACGSQVLASASTAENELAKGLKHGGNIDAAKAVGKLVSERAQAQGIKEVAFDKSGYKYHGRIKALADAAREEGMLL